MTHGKARSIARLPGIARRVALSAFASFVSKRYLNTDKIYDGVLHTPGTPVDALVYTVVYWAVHLAPIVIFFASILITDALYRRVLVPKRERRVLVRRAKPSQAAAAIGMSGSARA